MSTEKKFLGFAESEHGENLIHSLEAVPPGETETKPTLNGNEVAGPTDPHSNQPPEKHVTEEPVIAGMPSLPTTTSITVTEDGQVVVSKLVMEEDSNGESDNIIKNKEESTSNDDTTEEAMAKDVKKASQDSKKPDELLCVPKSDSEEPVSKPSETRDEKMDCGAASENKKGAENSTKGKLI